MVNNKKCPVCGKYKKPWFELCYECSQKGEEAPPLKELENKEYIKNAKHNFHKVEPNTNYPSHSILYRDLHYLENVLVISIFDLYGWIFEKKGFFGIKTTKYKIKIEENNWDLIINIKDTPEPKLKRILKEKRSFV